MTRVNERGGGGFSLFWYFLIYHHMETNGAKAWFFWLDSHCLIPKWQSMIQRINHAPLILEWHEWSRIRDQQKQSRHDYLENHRNPGFRRAQSRFSTPRKYWNISRKLSSFVINGEGMLIIDSAWIALIKSRSTNQAPWLLDRWFDETTESSIDFPGKSILTQRWINVESTLI